MDFLKFFQKDKKPSRADIQKPKDVDDRLAKRLRVKACVEALMDGNIDSLSRLFYRHLFHLDMSLKTVFPGNVVFLNRKFVNMLGIFKDVKHLEPIQQTVVKLGERHILQYGVEIGHLDTGRDALILALKDHLKDAFTPELEAAWRGVFDEVATLMALAMAQVDRTQINKPINHDAAAYDLDLLGEIGGEDVITQVHERFYTVLFDHSWLGQFFYGKSKEALVYKQTQFMVAAFNGPNNYIGDTPAFVHMHMFITDEMADLRETLLRKAILDQGLSASVADRWLKMDRSFRAGIVKKSVDECVLKCRGQVPVIAKKPLGTKI
jgi:truncated hemoglobin YjbI/hemoglobin-like flavoprotein